MEVHGRGMEKFLVVFEMVVTEIGDIFERGKVDVEQYDIWSAGAKKKLSLLKNELSPILCLSGKAGRQAGACPTWLD
tara:strand:- start:726 stop:956 length:231 start_codon:yes stop_codon:yes gene_type:complete